MKKLRLTLFISLISACTNSAKSPASNTSEDTYKVRFNNLRKLPLVKRYIETKGTGTIVLVQSEGCTECNLEKLGFLKDSLVQVHASPLIVVSSTMDSTKDYAYQLFRDKFGLAIYHSDTMEKLGLSLRGFYLVSFRNNAIDTWSLYDKIIK